MPEPAIRVQNLSKRYRIGAAEQTHDTLAAALAYNFRRPLENLRRLRSLTTFSDNGSPSAVPSPSTGRPPSDDTIWALKDVSFDVQPGEVVGIIGRNGAGKSTLLKILSRITHPTSGRVELNGRVSSLLEVGTGFHPELTGRENIYLNGTILGMRKAEIDHKLDKIVDFSGVEEFIDTPVKRYSSGMRVRLAFSVAAHLEPEILLVDEVLAVGDAEFQKKCLRKMGDVAKEGQAVLFVSHNMAAVQRLCTRAILLERGETAFDNAPSKTIDRYLNWDMVEIDEHDLLNHAGRRKGSIRVLKGATIESNGRQVRSVCMGSPLSVHVYIDHNELIQRMRFGVAIEDSLGQRLVNFSPSHQAPELANIPFMRGTIVCEIPAIKLLPGIYYITLILSDGEKPYIDRIDRAIQFTVEQSDVFGTGYAPGPSHGIFYQDARWILMDGRTDNV